MIRGEPPGVQFIIIVLIAIVIVACVLAIAFGAQGVSSPIP